MDTSNKAVRPDDVQLQSGQLLRALEQTLAELAEFTAHLRDQVIELQEENHDAPG